MLASTTFVVAGSSFSLMRRMHASLFPSIANADVGKYLPSVGSYRKLPTTTLLSHFLGVVVRGRRRSSVRDACEAAAAGGDRSRGGLRDVEVTAVVVDVAISFDNNSCVCFSRCRRSCATISSSSSTASLPLPPPSDWRLGFSVVKILPLLTLLWPSVADRGPLY